MKKLFAILALLIVTVGSIWYYYRDSGEETSGYRFVTLEQGDLESVVSSTGNLEAITNVQVGTQVSGIVTHIFADFNDQVRKNQIVALIDTTQLINAIRESEANLERVQAQLAKAERDYARIQELYEKKVTTEVEFIQADYDVKTARSSLKSADLNMERAQRNLEYATIRAPITGTVIERNVDVGQTVAASLSAPQLFLIAADLARMQILASVDESDIGLIQEGQKVRFTVQAYPDDMFEALVRQVRLQSTIQENVVNYTVVVDVDNADGRLLPGMTATLDFIIQRAENIMKIPNAALRFRPSEDMMAAMQQNMERNMENLPDSMRSRFAGRRAQMGADGEGSPPSIAGGMSSGGDSPARLGGANGGFPGSFGGANASMLWYLDDNGNVAAARVQTGISDGIQTEVIGRDLVEGMQLIVGITQSTVETRTTNPFQQQQGGFRGGPPGMF